MKTAPTTRIRLALSLLLFIGGMLVTLSTGCSSNANFYHLPPLEFDQVDYQYPVERAAVRNLEVGYIDVGSGPETLILIHGLGSNAKAWLRNISSWGEEYRVIAVDLPGYGYSSKGDYPYSLSFYGQVLTELLDGLEISEATFVGHSLGGQIALVTALEHPERVSKLVLFAPAGFEEFTRGEKQWFKNVMTVELVRDTPVRGIAENLHANFYDTPVEAEFMIADRIQVRGASDFEDYCYAVTRNVAAMVDDPVFSRLEQISQPTLVVFGKNDGLIPNPYLHGGYTQDVAEKGVAALPNGELEIVPECGHFVQFERPDVVNPLVLEFLRRN